MWWELCALLLDDNPSNIYTEIDKLHSQSYFMLCSSWLNDIYKSFASFIKTTPFSFQNFYINIQKDLFPYNYMGELRFVSLFPNI